MHPLAHQRTVPYPYYKKEMPESISIVTGTYNHTHFVKQLVWRLVHEQNQLPKNYEIVIGDTGSDEENQDAMLEMMEEYRGIVPIKYVMYNKNEHRGVIPHFHAWSFCVNAAFAQVDNDVVIYCDSSILVPPDFVLSLGCPHVDNEKLFVRCTTYNYTYEETAQSLATSTYKKSWEEVWNLLAKKKTSLGRSGWSVKTQELLKVHGADTRFTHYACHDDDMILRMMMNGCKNMHSDTCAIHQRHSDTDRNATDGYNAKILQGNIASRNLAPTPMEEFLQHDWVKTNA